MEETRTTPSEVEKQLLASEVRYRQIVETAEEGIWIIDASSKTTFANSRMAEMLGCTADEMMGMSMYDFIDSEWQATAQGNVKRRQDSIREQHDFKFIRKDGGVLWAIVAATPIFENGQYAGALGMVTDITARKTAEEELKATMWQLQDTLESISDAFFSLDEDFRVIYFNRAAERILNKKREEVVGRRLFDVFPEGRGTIFEQEYTRALSEKVRVNFETNFLLPPYENWYSVNVYPQVNGIAVYFRVQTQRKRAEESLRLVEQRYETLFNVMLDAFALHEIICDEAGEPVDYRFLQVNPVFEKQVGLSADHIIGKTVLELWPSTEKYWIQTYGKVALTGEPVTFEDYSGELGRWYKVAAYSPAWGQFASVFEDITDRKTTEEVLRRVKQELDHKVQERTSELVKTNRRLTNEVAERRRAELRWQIESQKLKRILDTMPGGVYILSRDYDIEYVNPHMIREFGPVDGQKCYMYYHNRKEVCPWCVNERVFAGETVHWELYFDKIKKTYELFDTPLVNADGSLSKLEIFYDVTDRKKAEMQVRQRNRELAALNEIGQAITSTLDLHQVLAELLVHLQNTIDAQLCTVGLIDAETEDVVFYNPQRGPNGIELGWEQRFKKGEGLAGWVISNKQSVLLDDLTLDPRPKVGLYAQFNFFPHSMGLVPLIVKKQVIGTIGIFHEQIAKFSSDDLRLLEAVAAQAAVIIHNAGLYEAEQKSHRRAEILHNATLALSSSLNIQTVLETLLDHLHLVIPYQSAHVFLMEDEEDAFVHVARGEEQWPEDERMLGRRVEIRSLPILKPLRTGETIYIPDLSQQPELRAVYPLTCVRSWLALPLMSEGQMIGMCALEHSQTEFFNEELVHWARALTHQAAIAVQNAWLFEQVRKGRERLQALSHRLVEIQESERRYISRELHDEAGQTLASLMMGLHLLEREAGDQPAIIEHCRKLKKTANTVMEEIHRLAIDLRPAALDRLGLTAALRQHIERVSDLQKLPIEFHSNSRIERMDGEVETAIYRIVQEALTNIVRHARATRADVLMDLRGDTLIVIVEDNGIGFDAQSPVHNRLGTLGMRERADMLGGKLTIESSPGRGTTILLEVPYVDSDPDRR